MAVHRRTPSRRWSRPQAQQKEQEIMPALDKLRILDLTPYEAGTSSTQILAWLGADVVKVERPGVGDPGRHTERTPYDSIYFLSFNANKRSVALDLQTQRGKELFLQLLPQFDAVTENFTLGTMEKLGLGYETLAQVHPGIIYAAIKGFGTYGPYAGFKSFEMIAEATGGGFSVTGERDGPPMRPGPVVGDTGAGLHLALGIVSAYVQRLSTGRGQKIEVSMQENVASFIRTRLSHRERPGNNPVQREGNRTVVPTDMYACAPGGPNDYVYIMVNSTRMWDAFVTAIDRPDLAVDERFANHWARVANGDALYAEIAAWTKQRTKYEVMEHLGAAGVPCGAVLDSDDLFKDRHLRERNAIRTVVHPERGAWEFIAPVIRMSDSEVELRPAPLLGQHTAEVLQQELGIAGAALQDLAEAGVIQTRDLTTSAAAD
jgi:formyl-CoA transferase